MAGRRKQTPDAMVAEPLSDQTRYELMRTVVENAPVIMFALDSKGTVIFAEGAPNRTGLTVSDVLNVSIFDLLPDMSRAELEIALYRVLSGDHFTMNINVRGITFEARLSPSFDANGEATGVLGVLHDITERVRTEAALRRQNAYLATLHEVTLALVNRLDVNDLLQTIIREAAALSDTQHGYLCLVSPERDGMVIHFGSGVFEQYVGLCMAHGEGAAGTVWATGEPLYVEQYDQWSGRSAQIEQGICHSIAAVPLKSRDEVVGVLGVAYREPNIAFGNDEMRQLEQFAELASIALDNARLYTAAQQELAERKRVEAALRQSEERYRTIIETIEDGYYETDLDGHVCFLNDSAARILGGEREQFTGQRYHGFSDESEARRVADTFQQVRQSGQSVRALDVKIRRPSGELRFLEVSVSPMRDSTGQLVGFRGIARDVTDRRQIEQALQASEERYRSVVAAMAEGVMLHDSEGRIVACNESAARVLQLDVSDLIGKSPIDYADTTIREDGTPFPVDEHPLFVTLHSGQPQSNVVVGLRLNEDGIKWLSINSQPIFRTGERQPEAVVISFSDITASKLHAEALERSERRNKTLLNAIPDSIFVVSRDGRYVEVNVEDETGLPAPPARMIGRSVYELPFGAVDPDRVMASLERAIGTGELQVFEYGDARVGEKGYFEVRLAALNDGEVLVMVRDMTDRNQAIMELSKRINQLATLQLVDDELTQTLNVDYVLDIALSAIMQVSEADGAFIALAEGDQMTLVKTSEGYPLQVGQPAPDDGAFAQVLATREPIFSPLVQASDLSVSCLTGTCAQIIMPLVSHDDLIGLINLESCRSHVFDEELFDFMALLTARVAVALDNARLYSVSQAHLAEVRGLYQQVSELEQLKTQMIRVAAHDIRSPLGVVNGYLSILQEELGEQAELYQPFIQPMYRAMERMEQMAADILSLERVHAGQGKVLETVNLGELVDRAVLDSRPMAVMKKQELDFVLPSETMNISGDPVQLYEAISNLINNAIKYTGEGGRINVRLGRVDGNAVFEVEDNGIGVPEEHQSKLFQPFYRVKNQETRKIDGTGLGLYLVKMIIDRHGGAMHFHSQHGKGSTFGFKLPISKDANG